MNLILIYVVKSPTKFVVTYRICMYLIPHHIPFFISSMFLFLECKRELEDYEYKLTSYSLSINYWIRSNLVYSSIRIPLLRENQLDLFDILGIPLSWYALLVCLQFSYERFLKVYTSVCLAAWKSTYEHSISHYYYKAHPKKILVIHVIS